MLASLPALGGEWRLDYPQWDDPRPANEHPPIERRAYHLGYRAERVAEDGVSEICEALESGALDRTPDTITIDWYKQLLEWHERLKRIELHGGLLELGSAGADEPVDAHPGQRPPGCSDRRAPGRDDHRGVTHTRPRVTTAPEE
jgi:hypothetical protein